LEIGNLGPEAQRIIERNYKRCGATRLIMAEIQTAREEAERRFGRTFPTDDPLIGSAMKYALNSLAGKGADRRGEIACKQVLDSLDRKLFTSFYVLNKK
jgi:hypothetical protein